MELLPCSQAPSQTFANMLTLNPSSNPQLGTLSIPISQMRKLRLPEDKTLVCSHVEWSGGARSGALICLRVNDYECFPPGPHVPWNWEAYKALRSQGRESLRAFPVSSQEPRALWWGCQSTGTRTGTWGNQVREHCEASYIPASQKACGSFAGSYL